MVTLIVGTVLSSVSIYRDLGALRDSLDKELSNVLEMNRSQALLAVYQVNSQQARKLTEGLLQHPALRGATLIDDFGEELSSNYRNSASYSSVTNWLSKQLFAQEHTLSIEFLIPPFNQSQGMLTIVVDDKYVINEFVNRSAIRLYHDLTHAIVVSLLLLIFFYFYLSRPIKDIVAWINALSDDKKSKLQVNYPYRANDELGRLVNQFAAVWSERLSARDELWKQAISDELTKAPNRRHFLDTVRERVAASYLGDYEFAIMYIDLDRFKEINDSMGHHFGDILITEAAMRLSRVAGSNMLARIGGDEFGLIINGPRVTKKELEVLGYKLIQSLEMPFHIQEHVIHLSGSIGIARCPQDACEVDAILQHADQAMYSAKNAGRGNFKFFSADLQQSVMEKFALTSALRLAMERKEFELAFQPIVDLEHSRVVKAEVLLRWNHPELGYVPPSKFIPLAEETGLIIPIGDWVFRKALIQTKYWREAYGIELQVSINMSPVQFRMSEQKFDSWLSMISELNLPGSALNIEITEGLLLDDSPAVTSKLHRFREKGVAISIDDFGTGYSSLAYLRKFDIDYLKIDRQFVKGLEKNEDDIALCQAIISMAHRLGIKVIAEGIESSSQFKLLRKEGCDMGQGFFFSKAVSATDFSTNFWRPDYLDDRLA
ncbi:putative bifunctional diguanylate cyclase/phosphodiesterase [Parasalinivibrio latis]|uniref:putative bifunctional diguanylate cyclase/phosphodiesterase n=1 Tax=Parasalinivibrio latis TaxID=2952610 RepID=UPI003DA1D9BB